MVSNIVDVPGSKTPFELRRDWLFIGGFQHPPNIDAVLFFLKQVYPLVSDRLGDAKFYIIGDKAPPEIVALATGRIIVAGLQRDVRLFFDNERLSVAPLRFGAGVKGKINQSMAFGVPVVATSLGVEGTDLRHREDVIVSPTNRKILQRISELSTNPGNFGIVFRKTASRKLARCIPLRPRGKNWKVSLAMSTLEARRRRCLSGNNRPSHSL